MLWWIVLAVVVIGLALLWVRGQSRSGSASRFDPDSLRRTRGDAESHGGGGPGGF